jgi:hypothetical protein
MATGHRGAGSKSRCRYWQVSGIAGETEPPGLPLAAGSVSLAGTEQTRDAGRVQGVAARKVLPRRNPDLPGGGPNTSSETSDGRRSG